MADDIQHPARNKLDVLALCGSLRHRSLNRLLLHAAAECAPASMNIRIWPDLGILPLFNEDLEGDAVHGAPAASLRRAVLNADALLIATPEYNQSLSAPLKNGIDWLSRPPEPTALAAKPVAIMGVTAGRWGTRLSQSALRHVLTATECHVLPSPQLYVAEGAKRFNDTGVLIDDSIRINLQALLGALAVWISMLRDPGVSLHAKSRPKPTRPPLLPGRGVEVGD